MLRPDGVPPTYERRRRSTRAIAGPYAGRSQPGRCGASRPAASVTQTSAARLVGDRRAVGRPARLQLEEVLRELGHAAACAVSTTSSSIRLRPWWRRVNAIVCPSGDQTGQASAVAKQCAATRPTPAARTTRTARPRGASSRAHPSRRGTRTHEGIVAAPVSANTSTPCTGSTSSTAPTVRCWRTSRSRSSRARRSACSGRTAPASRRCCGSWPARRSRPPASPSWRRTRRVGLLEQEPELDPAKTVRENVEDGVRELRDLLDRFNQISAQFSEPDADFDALLAEQAKVQDQVDRRGAWQLEEQLDHAMDALRLPEGDRDVDVALGRRAPPRRALPAAPQRARPPAARRADEPPRRRVGVLARALPRRLQGHRRRRDA